MNLRMPLSLSTVALSLGLACASSNSGPNVKAESSSAAIRAAEEVGATHNPKAALHLQLAKEQFEHASRLTKPDEREQADLLLLRAQTDAELALALARSESEKSEALGAIEKVKTLKQTPTP